MIKQKILKGQNKAILQRKKYYALFGVCVCVGVWVMDRSPLRGRHGAGPGNDKTAPGHDRSVLKVNQHDGEGGETNVHNEVGSE